MGFIRRWVFYNWHLKLLALLISYLLWATYTAEPASEFGYQVPLEFRNVPAALEIAGDVPTQIHVRLRGRAALLRRITPTDLPVAVDLAGSGPGETLVRLTADQVEAPFGAEVVRLRPSEIRVRLVARGSPP